MAALFTAALYILALFHVALFCLIWVLNIWMVTHPGFRLADLFEEWYPQYAHVFSRVREKDCTFEFEHYLNGTLARPLDEIVAAGGTTLNAVVQPVVDCLLENTNEYVKVQMATGQVLLGLMPSILALAGPTAEEFATLSVLGGRRVLSYMLVLGAPVFFVSRAFDVVNPRQILEAEPRSGGCFNQPESSTWRRFCIVVGEYLLVFLCLFNTIQVTHQLGMQTINPIYSPFPYYPLVWVIAGPIIHFIARVLVKKRAKRYVRAGLKEEFDISAKVPSVDVNWRNDQNEADWKGNGTGFIVMSWIHSVGILVHLVFATGLFSGLQFIGATDCLVLLLRLSGSVFGCRMVLKYELDRLRLGVAAAKGKKDKEEDRALMGKV